MTKYRLLIVAFFIIGIIVGFGFTELYTLAVAPSLAPQLSLDQMYENAIEDAMVAKESEVYNGLTPITENNSNLTWQGDAGNRSESVL